MERLRRRLTAMQEGEGESSGPCHGLEHPGQAKNKQRSTRAEPPGREQARAGSSGEDGAGGPEHPEGGRDKRARARSVDCKFRGAETLDWNVQGRDE